VSIANWSGAEPDAGTAAATFKVSLSGTALSAVTVSFATAPGTAASPSDFVAASGTLTIPAGSSKATVPVTVVGDTLFEANERFFVSLSNASANAALGTARATGTLLNDD